MEQSPAKGLTFSRGEETSWGENPTLIKICSAGDDKPKVPLVDKKLSFVN
jgi:hypothetical protein